MIFNPEQNETVFFPSPYVCVGGAGVANAVLTVGSLAFAVRLAEHVSALP